MMWDQRLSFCGNSQGTPGDRDKLMKRFFSRTFRETVVSIGPWFFSSITDFGLQASRSVKEYIANKFVLVIVGCNKMPDESNLKRERFISTSVQGYSSPWWGRQGRQQVTLNLPSGSNETNHLQGGPV